MGFFGASSINNIPASIGDYTTPLTRNTFTILYALMAFGGPALGPLCSAFIQTDAGFQYVLPLEPSLQGVDVLSVYFRRWNLRVMAIFCTVTSILVAFVPETHGPTLLKWRVKKEGNAPPPVGARKILAVYRVALARPIIYLFSGELSLSGVSGRRRLTLIRRAAGDAHLPLHERAVRDPVWFLRGKFATYSTVL